MPGLHPQEMYCHTSQVGGDHALELSWSTWVWARRVQLTDRDGIDPEPRFLALVIHVPSLPRRSYSHVG